MLIVGGYSLFVVCWWLFGGGCLLVVVRRSFTGFSFVGCSLMFCWLLVGRSSVAHQLFVGGSCSSVVVLALS